MTKIRNYTFGLWWLVLVIVLFAVTPAQPRADNWNWEDEAFDCPDTSGWCLDLLDIIMMEARP